MKQSSMSFTLEAMKNEAKEFQDKRSGGQLLSPTSQFSGTGYPMTTPS